MAIRSKLVATASTSAFAIALGTLAAPAYAQDNGEGEENNPTSVGQEDDVIVVTGIRASIDSSVAKKRASTSIVEVVTAEDIGKLPDSSIAETLSRLPGLATQRFDGRASKLSVRGLSPDFTTTTLNGREMVSSDNNRAVEFDQFPAELLSGATIYKTPDAELTSQAIGGTVDLQTVRPLNYTGDRFIVGVRGEINDNGKLNPETDDKGYRVNVAYIDQNAAGTVGWSLGYARMVQPIQEQYIHTWGYSNLGTEEDPAFFIDGIKPYVKSNELTRDGLMGTLQFEPKPGWNIALDAFYSKFADDQTLRGQEIAGYTAASRDILEVQNGVVTQGRWNGIRTMSRNDFSDRDSDNFAIGANGTFEFDNGWTLELDASHSFANRTYQAYETYSTSGRGQTGPSDDITYTLGGSNGLTITSGLDYADPAVWELGDNLGWGGGYCFPEFGWQCDSQDGFVNEETSDDSLTAFKAAAKKELESAISGISVGAKYSFREKEHTRFGQFLTLRIYPDTLPIPAEFLLPATDLDFLGLGGSISYDARAIVDSGVYFTTVENPRNRLSDDWSVDEAVFNAFAMADLDMDLGGVYLTGNFGVQAVHTDQSSLGYATTEVGGELIAQQINKGDEYWDILPSTNLIFGVSDNTKIRFGAARVLARAPMDKMNASRRFDYNAANAGETDILQSPWSGSGGNPNLRPWRAWQFDLSLEQYFGSGGYVAIAPFYKKLLNYTYDELTVQDFSGVVAPGPVQPILTQGLVTTPANGEGGKIYGIEFSASVPFDTFTEALEGFGFIGSASLTRSEVRKTAESEPEQLPGLSREVINGTLYYDKGGFGARVSARHRSAFLAESFAIGLSRQTTQAKGETIIDAQLSYDLTNAGIEGLTIYLQGSNLTDEPFIQYYNDDPTQFRHWHTYGRNFLAGATFKF